MGVREDTLALLQQGHTPGEIAEQMGVGIKTTLGYLDQMIGESRIRRSDILLSIPAKLREHPRNEDDRIVVTKYGNAAQLLGDIYEDVRLIETTLHSHIRSALEDAYGPHENDWWRKEIPESIRKQCQSRREEDDAPADVFCYTDLLDLRTIVDKQWAVLEGTLPRDLRSVKKRLLDDLMRLNRIRRSVMHPVRFSTPTEEDFDFLRALRRKIEELR